MPALIAKDEREHNAIQSRETCERKIVQKIGSVDRNYSTGRARPLISHFPSKATTFEDYHISISFFGSVRKVSKWTYQKSLVSDIYHRIQGVPKKGKSKFKDQLFRKYAYSYPKS